MSNDTDLGWPAFALFMRQLTHDVRNQLNGLELELTLASEFVSGEEGAESLSRIREQLHHIAGHLRSLSLKFADASPTLAPIAAAELFLIFQEQAMSMEKLPPVKWSHQLKDEEVSVDAGDLANAAREVLVNAREFGSEALEVRGCAEAGTVIYQFVEPKSAPLDAGRWGRTPFQSTKRSGYGLGLWLARRLVEANGGKLTHEYNSAAKQLITTLALPVAVPVAP